MTRTIDEALERFTLVQGAGDGEGTACAMTMLNWLDGSDEWTDSPPCAHRVLGNNVTQVNDTTATTSEQKAEIVRAGLTGVLDTWWIPTEVVAWALSGGRGETISAFGRLIRALMRISEWKNDKKPVDLTDANLTRANLADANRPADPPLGWKPNVFGLLVREEAA